MAKTFECRHTGVLCDAKVSGQTDEEVLTKAIAHARDAHGVDLSQSKTLIRYAHSLVRDDAAEGR